MKKFFIFLIPVFSVLRTFAQENDSLIIAQSFANLYLTSEYFDSLPAGRINKIVKFIQRDLDKIRIGSLENGPKELYRSCSSLLLLERARLNLATPGLKSRSDLLSLKKLLDKSLSLYDQTSRLSRIRLNSYYEFTGFTRSSQSNIEYAISSARGNLASFCNKDIYPDIRRIYEASKRGRYSFDSLDHYLRLYNLSHDFSILEKQGIEFPKTTTGIAELTMAEGLDVILKAMQIRFVVDSTFKVDALALYEAYDDLESIIKVQDPIHFRYKGSWEFCTHYIHKDNFFKTEFGESFLAQLLLDIRKRFPDRPAKPLKDELANMQNEGAPEKYFFPANPPLASCKFSMQNYRPALSQLKDVNRHLALYLHQSGYDGRRHYYYYKGNGFAITTDLERIDHTGKPKADDRWAPYSKEKDFSLVNIFRIIFFSSDEEFRILALIISSQQVMMQPTTGSVEVFSRMREKSYDELPQDISDVVLPGKILTVLVYHFHQNDIGEIPQMDVTHRLTVQDHLRHMPLSAILTQQP